MAETGLKHEWFNPKHNGYPNLGDYESCRKCGIVKSRDPIKADAPTCRGQVRISLR